MKALLVIDAQSEFANKTQMNLISAYIRYNSSEYARIFRTIFRNEENSSFFSVLNWDKCTNPKTDNSIYSHETILKGTYGIPNRLIEKLKHYDSVDIIGCDIEACVLATCFQLFDAGIKFTVKTDLCFSSADKLGSNYKLGAIRIMRNCFGKSIK